MIEESSQISALSTEYYACIVEIVLGILVGIIFAAVLSWRVALVCFAMLPLTILGGFINDRMTHKDADEPPEESELFLTDIICNYRTIKSNGNQVEKLVDKYDELLEEPTKKRLCNAHIAGGAFGYSSCIRFIFIGVVFYVGGAFIASLQLKQENVYKSIMIIFTTFLGGGLTLRTVPDTHQA